MNISGPVDSELKPEDQKRIDELKEISVDVTKDMEEFRFYMAGEKLYHYVWHTFADKIIEESKVTINDPSTQRMLLELLSTSLKLLHPFMPFITEEIYSKLPASGNKILMVEIWPV